MIIETKKRGHVLDEIDLRLLDALHTSPRASWTLVGRVLDVDPITLGRRWQRLTASGAAWVTAYVGPAARAAVCVAVIEVDCEQGATSAVAGKLADIPQVLTIKQTAGGRDLMLTVHTHSLAAMSVFVADELAGVAGIRATRTWISTNLIREGSSWRGEALDPTERARLENRGPTGVPIGRSSTASVILRPVDRRIFAALSLDGRMSNQELARRAGTSVATIGRRLPTLIDSSAILLRCDVARPLSERPVSAVYFADIPAQQLAHAGARIGELAGTRMCTAIAGRYSLIIDAWLRRPEDIHEYEVRLSEVSPNLVVHDRSLVLRTVKHLGRILDETGRGLRAVSYQMGPDPSE
jgi:DNA-binding Lrp family transcriptional regulator